MIEAEILLPEPSSLAFDDRVPFFAEHIFQWWIRRLAWHRVRLDSRSCPVYWPRGQVRQTISILTAVIILHNLVDDG